MCARAALLRVAPQAGGPGHQRRAGQQEARLHRGDAVKGAAYAHARRLTCLSSPARLRRQSTSSPPPTQAALRAPCPVLCAMSATARERRRPQSVCTPPRLHPAPCTAGVVQPGGPGAPLVRAPARALLAAQQAHQRCEPRGGRGGGGARAQQRRQARPARRCAARIHFRSSALALTSLMPHAVVVVSAGAVAVLLASLPFPPPWPRGCVAWAKVRARGRRRLHARVCRSLRRCLRALRAPRGRRAPPEARHGAPRLCGLCREEPLRGAPRLAAHLCTLLRARQGHAAREHSTHLALEDGRGLTAAMNSEVVVVVAACVTAQFAHLPDAKSFVPEDHELAMGLYWGAVSGPCVCEVRAPAAARRSTPQAGGGVVALPSSASPRCHRTWGGSGGGTSGCGGAGTWWAPRRP